MSRRVHLDHVQVSLIKNPTLSEKKNPHYQHSHLLTPPSQQLLRPLLSISLERKRPNPNRPRPRRPPHRRAKRNLRPRKRQRRRTCILQPRRHQQRHRPRGSGILDQFHPVRLRLVIPPHVIKIKCSPFSFQGTGPVLDGARGPRLTSKVDHAYRHGSRKRTNIIGALASK